MGHVSDAFDERTLEALPAPEGDAYASREYEAPVGKIEVALAEIWTELLRVERVGRWDHFFELGGHSLLAVQVVSRVRQALGVEASLGDLFLTAGLAFFLLQSLVAVILLEGIDWRWLAADGAMTKAPLGGGKPPGAIPRIAASRALAWSEREAPERTKTTRARRAKLLWQPSGWWKWKRSLRCSGCDARYAIDEGVPAHVLSASLLAIDGVLIVVAAWLAIGMAGIVQWLELNGFARASTVREPGDYAVRGGILDLFAPGMDLPVRLDPGGELRIQVRAGSFPLVSTHLTSSSRISAAVPGSVPRPAWSTRTGVSGARRCRRRARSGSIRRW